jgi:NAD(P)-dependent dehydrogenase (short-subunit alcohol dehydrogenase family)
LKGREIVTGAASGIGLATATRLNADSKAREGRQAQLVVADVAAELLEEATIIPEIFPPIFSPSRAAAVQ